VRPRDDEALPGGPLTSPLGVMRRKTLALAATAVLVTAGAAFVMVPGFPEPSSLITLDYASLQARLGPPSVVFGDKFVGWSRPRYVATWTLEARLEFPLRPQSRSAEIHRCLWIQWAGYAILCRWSYATPLQPEPASA
jgi:hypothetical protein